VDDVTLIQLFAQIDVHLARQDEILAKMDERQAKQDQILALIQESTERTAQYHARTAQMLAEHTLLMDRILERLPRRP
jgi:hypothetical protein